jgi:phosphoribosylaminoimidazole carboxylase PurK protein
MIKLGILGGGQLARMIIEENSRYGIEFHILSKEHDSPAGLLTPFEVVGDWNDRDIVKNFADKCDIITLENEFIDFHILEAIEKSGKKILPGSEIIRLIQDKLFQKKTLTDIGIPVAEYCEVNSGDDVKKFAKQYGYPVILKSRTMGYDGKGNVKVSNESEIDNACIALSQRGKLMCEKFVEFDKEIATQAVRSESGEINVYPVVETIQENHICKYVIASQMQFSELKERVDKICKKILSSMSYPGVMGIEMFLCNGEILVNELAPRVHNSGHYTIEGCYTSQFENHIRAILGLPLGSAEMKVPAAVMINILGERNGTAKVKGIDSILVCKETFIHLYGKTETRIERKMGHITITGSDSNALLKRATEARRAIGI